MGHKGGEGTHWVGGDEGDVVDEDGGPYRCCELEWF